MCMSSFSWSMFALRRCLTPSWCGGNSQALVGDSLELMEACTSSGLGLAPTQALFPLDFTEQNSSVVEEEHLHGCISPHGSPCPLPQPDASSASKSEGMDEILAPVLQITPELNEFCGECFVVLPLELGSLKPSRWPRRRHCSRPPMWTMDEC
jgi:hypothetical protein